MITFAFALQNYTNMSATSESLSVWIEKMPQRGYYTFTKMDIEEHFPSMSKNYIKSSLHRLAVRKIIISPWRNFYVVIPTEFALKGIIPPVFFMDAFMKFVNRQYYVALLNAAVFYGASHQSPQTFTVMTTSPTLRDVMKNGNSIVFVSRKEIPTAYIQQKKTQTGYINVSSPELTAVDLVAFEKNVGGLNRVCTVLNELIESVDFNRVHADFFMFTAAPVIQRLGYIIEFLLEDKKQADILYGCAKSADMVFRKIPFKVEKSTDGCELNDRWKVIINQKIEIDE